MIATCGNPTWVGRIVDRTYRIDAIVGQGSVGTVYRATDVTTGETVALKQWHGQALDDQVRGRFLREAKALDTLDHPHIVRVQGHGLVDGVPYVALEYLEGQTLDAWLNGGDPLDTDFALEVARQALSAIDYAHQRNVVHRDIKPENIFLCRAPEGRCHVKILDYGLAKFMTPTDDPTKDVALTVTGMVIGTPLYMPPEQAAGSSVDLPVDVYAMGCVLFEMLTGRPPFLGESHLELLAAHLRTPIPKIAEARPDVQPRPELQALIDHALAKKQTQRFANAGTMLQALERVPEPALVPRRLASTESSNDALRDKRPSVLSVALAAAVVLTASVLFALLR